MTPLPFQLDFYEAPDGSKPCLTWIKEDLTPLKRRALGAAMEQVLQVQGIAVCEDKAWGLQLGHGLFEFRLMRQHRYQAQEGRRTIEKIERISLRVFCHAYGDQRILLLHEYDKGKRPGSRRQQREIAVARKRLRAWRRNCRKAEKEHEMASRGRARRRRRA